MHIKSIFCDSVSETTDHKCIMSSHHWLFLQGFLTDLLKKANRNYDDKKLKEYTQTIVSIMKIYSFFPSLKKIYMHASIEKRNQSHEITDIGFT